MRITIHGFRIMRVSRQGAFLSRGKTKFSYAPKFSVVVPLYHTRQNFKGFGAFYDVPKLCKLGAVSCKCISRGCTSDITIRKLGNER